MTTIAAACPFIPLEWIAAHGLAPWRPILRGASHAARAPIHGVCPHVRDVAAALFDTGGGIDAAIVTTRCDQMRRGGSWLAECARQSVFTFNLPATWRTPAARAMYRDELMRLGRWLIERGGQAPSTETLLAHIAEHSARRQALRNLPNTHTGRAQFDALVAYYNENVLPETAATPPPRRRGVLLVGGPLRVDDGALFDAFDRAGLPIMIDGTETGLRTLAAPADAPRVAADPVDELTRMYFDTIPDAFRRPNDLLYRWIDEAIGSFDCRGVALVRRLWCDHWQAEAGRLKAHLSVPMLDLDLEDVEPAAARIGTRLDAFLETIQ